jgi:hypothetical protein
MTSSTAQGVNAVKQCKFPPFSGYRTMVSAEASKTASVFTLAKRDPVQEEETSCVSSKAYHFVFSKKQKERKKQGVN